ncbi:hypothetical protein D9M71_816680 [compost metagenome]
MRGAARHGQASAQAGQPFVFTQGLPGLAGRGQGAGHFFKFAQHAFQRILRHAGVIAQAHQRGALALQVLQHGAFHVGAFASVEQIEKRGDGHLMLA